MSAALSKRQQARNEKLLHELVHSVPGNNFCADCQARNPAWASWSLGVFLCMRCATIHRKLGTHISKVKSLSMDSWSNEQVENMKKVGNIVSNRNYNPQNKRPTIPVDTDEADGAMERFIRQKYMNRALASSKKHDTGSTESDETPPPLPPKTPSRFGIRSASSVLTLGSKARKAAAAQESPQPHQAQRLPHENKASQVFGASVQYDGGVSDDTNRKLVKLRDMGFADEQRNALVLKGVGGNLEKTIESLVRLGEGEGRSLVATRQTSLPTPLNRSLTPAGSFSSRDAGRGRPISPASTNPFDILDTAPAQPLSSQSTGTLQNRNPYLSSNPYGAPHQQNASAIDLAFQNMSLAPPSQPLFPNHTGGMAAPQPDSPQPMYQQPLTPQAPSAPQNYPSISFHGSQTYPQPALQAAANYNNPYFTNQQQQPQQPLAVNTAGFPGNYGSNPFTRSPTWIQSPTLAQIPEQAQQNFYTPSPQAAQQQPQSANPFISHMMQVPRQQQQQQQQQQNQVPVYFQQQQQQPDYMQQQQPMYAPQRPDKASIMALYNYPQLAPTSPFQTQDATSQAPPTQAGTNPFFRSQTFPLVSQQQAPQQQTQYQQAQPVPMAASPAGPVSPVSNNPFMIGTGSTVGGPAAALINNTAPPQSYKTSRESMMAVGLEWSNGRHSPDAFASLSARDTR
ncbi:hypothetical protein B0H63DRAFT_236840 [Podospora didyma]|uniref:Arf-GAP domain-containing protein n=1 Tax=Podospora didyma TaxID=330526 RepID=A0AAE0KKU2_9PEZI|nr:hypothetical protein B0H63DRAFT_236840 [Podospora didyma]